MIRTSVIACVAGAVPAPATGPLVPGQALVLQDGAGASLFRVDPLPPFDAETVTTQPSGDVGLVVAGPHTIFGVENGPAAARILEIDSRTGESRLFVEVAGAIGVRGIAIEPHGDLLLLLADEVLRVARVAPHAVTRVSNGGLLVAARGIEVLPDGDLLVFEESHYSVLRIDPATGAQTVIPVAAPFVCCHLDLDPVAGDLVAVSTGSWPHRIDPGSGAATPIAPLGSTFWNHELAVEAGGDLLTVQGAGASGPLQRVEAGSGASSILRGPGSGPYIALAVVRPQCGNARDDDGDGWVDAADPQCETPEDDRETSACSDGLDNDLDGAVDLEDADCAGSDDEGETPACSNGIDDDGDGLADVADPHCRSAADDAEVAACANGLDDDGDGGIDHGGDPQCTSHLDDCEDALFCPPPAAVCSNGFDDDGDGLIDHPEDPACVNAFTASERPACDDGLDNDADGQVDLLDTADCMDAGGDGELPPCNDGLDNDVDGRVDFPLDPGCLALDDPDERPQCSDEVDNDGDGLVDHPADPECDDPGGRREAPVACGVGFELVLLPLLLGARRRRLRIAVLAGVLGGAGPAAADTASSLGSGGGEGAGPFAGLATTPEANPFTGAAGLRVPIRIPPGRRNATPDLALVYSSSTGPGVFGHGWGLPLGRIERSTRHGRPRCLASPGSDHLRDFVLSLGGGVTDLVHVGADRYQPRVDESHLEADADVVANHWVVRDRTGATYTFGDVPDARIFDRLDRFLDADFALTPPDCEFTSVWALTGIEDANGNTVEIDYEKVENTLVPAEIRYGANPSAGLAEHPFRVRFLSAPRESVVELSQRGVRQRLTRKVVRLEVEARPALGQPFAAVRSYDLAYEPVAPNGHLRLASVETDLLPRRSFTYTTAAFGHEEALVVVPPALPDHAFLRRSHRDQSVQRSLLDMDGDGAVDLVVAADGIVDHWSVYRGGPPRPEAPSGGFEATPLLWSHAVLPPDIPQSRLRDASGTSNVRTEWDTLDLDGDGVVDFVDARTTPWTVYPGACSSATSCGFGPGISWAAPAPYLHELVVAGAEQSSLRRLVDVSADGRPDLVIGAQVYLNTGSGLVHAPDLTFASLDVTRQVGNASVVTRDWFDFNADGLPDLLEQTGDRACVDAAGTVRIGVCGVGEGEGGVIRLRLNDGRGLGDAILLVTPFGADGVRTRVGSDPSSVIADFLDVNGDGLPDRVYWLGGFAAWGAGTNGWRVQLNRGGAGLEPLVYSPGGFHDLALPRSWSTHLGPIRHQSATANNVRTWIDVFDWDADGFLDHVDASAGATWTVHRGGPLAGPAAPPSLLHHAHDGVGGTTALAWTPSSHFDHRGADGAPDLPFHAWLVTGVRRSDGLCDVPVGVDPFDPLANPCLASGHERLRRYAYEGGLYAAADREFRGYRRVTETWADGSTREVWFHQDPVRRGKMERDLLFAGDPATGELVQRESFVWDVRLPQPFAGRSQLHRSEERVETFAVAPRDPGLDRCLVNRSDPPDDFGRVATTCSLACGSVPSGSWTCLDPVPGMVRTTTHWADPVPGTHVRERPSDLQTHWTDAGGTTRMLAFKVFRYDGGAAEGLPVGLVANGNVKQVHSLVEGGWAVVATAYDGFGNVTRVTDPEGGVTRNVYDTELFGAPTRFGLYPLERLAPPTGAVAHRVVTETDLSSGEPLQVTGENGEIARFALDGLGRRICEARPGEDLSACHAGGSFGHASETRFHLGDPAAPVFADRLSWIEVLRREPAAPAGFVVTRSYQDALGRSLGRSVQRVVGGASALETIVEGQVAYDREGRVVRRFVPYASAVGPVADPTALGVAFTALDYALNGSAWSDPLGRAHRSIAPDGRASRVFHEGLRHRAVDPAGREQWTLYDVFGREVRREHRAPAAASAELVFDMEYDGLGRLLRETVAGDVSTTVTRSWDLLGRLVALDDPDSGTWRFGYDLRGHPIHRDDPTTGRHVQWLRDALGRVTHRCVFDDGDEYVPLSDGCGSGRTDARFVYDETAQGNAGIGRLVRVVDDVGEERIVHDLRGRVIRRERSVLGVAAAIDFTWDEADRLSTITYPDGEVLTHGYDAAGRLRTLGSAARTYLSDVDHDRFGRVERFLHGNGVEDRRFAYGPEEAFRVERLQTGAAGGAAHLDLRYVYAADARIERIEDLRNPVGSLSNTASFAYDGLGRLLEVDAFSDGSLSDPLDESFAYDALGNLALKDGAVLHYGGAGAGPHQVTAHAGRSFGWDENGCRRAATGAGSEATYGYDALDRLVRVETPGGGVVEYRYDHAGRRAARRVDGGGWVRHFGPWAESHPDRGGMLVKHYFAGELRIASHAVQTTAFGPAASAGPLWIGGYRPPIVALVAYLLVTAVLLAGPGRRDRRLGIAVGPSRVAGSLLIVVVTSAPVVMAPTGCDTTFRTHHFHLDHRGSIQAVTGPQGGLLRQVRYGGYGDVRGRFDGAGAAVGASERLRHEFTGHASDPDTGLIDAGARIYDPALGQFLTLDPARQFASPYAYGPGDPLLGADPNGEAFGLGALVLIVGVIAVATGIEAFVETGDLGAAVGAFAISLASGAVLGLVVGPLVQSALQALANPVVTAGVQLAQVGLAVSSTVRAVERRSVVGAVVGAIGSVAAAHALAQGIAGQATAKTVAGQTGSGTKAGGFALSGDLEVSLNRNPLVVKSSELRLAADEGLVRSIELPGDVSTQILFEEGEVSITASATATLRGPLGIPLARGSQFRFDVTSGRLLSSDLVPGFLPFRLLNRPTTFVASRVIGGSFQPALALLERASQPFRFRNPLGSRRR